MNIIRSYISLHLKVISLIFIFSILFSKRSSAQQNVSSLQLYNYQFDHLTFENGLSFNLVTSIIKDKQGFIWIATIDGLNRYDGVSFKIYRHDAHNLNSLAGNSIYAMTLDAKGNIWMATDAALTEYIPATDSFKNFFVTTVSKNRSTRSLYVDSHNVVWFGDNDGLCRLNADGKIETFPIRHLYQRFSIGSIIEDDEGVIWVGTIQGLYSFDKQTHIFKRYLFDPGMKNENAVMCIIQDHEKNIWAGTWGGGVAKFDPHTGKFELYKYAGIRSNIVWSIYESADQPGKLWVGTADRGAAIFDKNKKSFEFVSIDPGNIYAFNSSAVSHIFDDHLGTLWFASHNGVIKLISTNSNSRDRPLSLLQKLAIKALPELLLTRNLLTNHYGFQLTGTD